MPRRDALNEKKRERLMQEHEQLQKLMLQSRSSVRRSSLKDRSEEQTTIQEQYDSADPVIYEDEEVPVKPVAQVEEPQVYPTDTHPQPLTENELFPTEEALHDSPKKESLTEKDLFPEAGLPSAAAQKSSVINVILPKEKVTGIEQPYKSERNETPPPEEPNEIPASEAQHNVEAVLEKADYSEAVAEDLLVQEEPALLTEENAAYRPERFEEKRSRSKKFSVIATLILALLIGFGAYYFYTTTNSPAAIAVTRTEKPPASAPAQPLPDTARSTTLPEVKSSGPQPSAEKETPKVSEKKAPAKPETKTVAVSKTEPSGPASNTGLGQYKVISKAYFHNEPDESTRRKAFIIHWNNAVLTPQEEKVGFVYVVFTNHLGQTSKGWLRKKDLRRLN